MSRRIFNQVEQGLKEAIEISESSKKPDLDSLLSKFYLVKSTADDAKKEADKYNTEIKDIMKDASMQEYESADFKAVLTVQEGTNFDTEKAMSIIKEQLPPELLEKVIKTREYLDDEALQDLIYNKQFDATLLNPCITPAEPIYRLRVSRVKK